MSRRVRWGAALVVAAVAGVAGVAGMVVAGVGGVSRAPAVVAGKPSVVTAQPTPDVVLVRFDGVPGTEVETLRVEGSAGATAEVLRSGGATTTFVAGAGDGGAAIRFPARDAKGVVVVGLRNAGSADLLSPGGRDFSFGADAKLDAGVDTDGDNIVEHGLSDDVGQYKLETDGGHFRCTVKGTAGRVSARIAEDPVPEVWYRALCARTGDAVSITLERLDTGEIRTAVGTGTIGTVRTEKATTPLSIGGKLTPAVKIAAWQPDQFNGDIGTVWVRFG